MDLYIPCPSVKSVFTLVSFSSPPVRVHPRFTQFKPQVASEALGMNPVEGGELPDARRLLVGPGRVSSFHRGNHQILRGMFGRNELEYLGVIPGPFEQRGAQGVGDKLSLPLTQDAV